jgi:hypothetical protein
VTQIDGVASIEKEARKAVIAALGEVPRYARHRERRTTGHAVNPLNPIDDCNISRVSIMIYQQ